MLISVWPRMLGYALVFCLKTLMVPNLENLKLWFINIRLTCWRSQPATGVSAAPLRPPAPPAWSDSCPAPPAAAPGLCSPSSSAHSPALQPPCGSALQLSGSVESGWSAGGQRSPPLDLPAFFGQRERPDLTTVFRSMYCRGWGAWTRLEISTGVNKKYTTTFLILFLNNWVT